jgi:Cft2 family RNA processing exonuclease
MLAEQRAQHHHPPRFIQQRRHGATGQAEYKFRQTFKREDMQPGQTFLFSASGGEVTRRCEVQEFDLTAHAQREDLLNFVGEVSPRVVLLGHGEAKSRQWFEEQIRARHPKIRVVQPEPGKVVEV